MARRNSKIARLDGGLNTFDPPPHTGPGDLTVADNVIVSDGALEKMSGTERVLNNPPNEHAYILDGESQYLRAAVRSTGSNIALQTTDWTVEVFFRMDSIPSGLGVSAILYRGVGEDSTAGASFTAADTDFCLYAIVNGTSGSIFVGFFGSDGSNTVSFTNSQAIEVGKNYRAAIVQQDVAGVKTFTSHVHEVGTSVPASGGGGTLVSPLNDSGSDLLIGAVVDEDSLGLGDEAHSFFHGIVQEVRIWNDELTTGQQGTYDDTQIANPAGESELLAHYPLTGLGTDTYFLESTKGTTGDGSGESPAFSIEPRTGTWRTSGHVLGSPSSGTSTFDTDGRTQFVVIPNAYLYRDQVPDDDGALPFPGQFFFSWKGTIRTLRDRATLFHKVQVADSDWVDHDESDTSTGHFATPPTETGQCFLELLDVGTSDFRFRFVVYHVVSGTTEATAVVTSSSLSVGTEYTVSCWITGSGTVAIKLDSDATDTSSMVGGGLPPTTPDLPGGQARKYHAVLGTCVKRTRQRINDASPLGIDVEYEMARAFDGEMRQVIIADVTSGNFVGVHAMNRDTDFTRSSITNLGLPIFSAWSFDDADGDDVEDYGIQTNPLSLSMDPGHVWGDSIIPTTTKALWKGMFEHRFQGKDGLEVRKVLGLAGGALYELDLTNRTFSRYVDGLRNDDGNVASVMRSRDSLVLCLGGKGRTNFHLWRDQLYGLSIDPPSGLIPYGLTDQLNDDAKLTQGEYLIGFAFYSAHLNKWSPMGPTATVEIRSKRANLAFGPYAEINQTHPCTPWSGAKGSAASVGREPFNLSNASLGNNQIDYESWVGPDVGSTSGSSDPDWWEDPPGATTDRETKTYKIKFISGGAGVGFITASNSTEVDADTVLSHVALMTPDSRAYMERLPDGRVRLCSAFVGQDAHLNIDQTFSVGGSGGPIGSNDAFAWIADASLPEEYIGTGETAHGQVLPTTSDKQVTHLGYFRSVNGDNQLRLVQLIPLGEQGFKDATPDELNTGEIFDITRGIAPVCSLVTDFEGRALYSGDKLNPQRVYFSEPGEPWNVPTQNLIDFLDGDTLAITGVGRTEGGVAVFKDETTFVLTQPTNPFVPFTVSVRSRDVGCLSPRAIVNYHKNLVYPAEQGFFRFDLSYPQYISKRIEPTWLSYVETGNKPVFGAHSRRMNCLLFSVKSGALLDGSGAALPDQMIVWSYGVGYDQSGRPAGWTRLTNLNAEFFSVLEDASDVEQLFYGDSFGFLYKMDVGTSYGPHTHITTTGLAVTAGGATSITIPKVSDVAKFPLGYVGLPVTLVRAADGSQETRFVTADSLGTPSVLTVDSAWTTNPVNGDTAMIGTIDMRAVSGDMSPLDPTVLHEVSGVLIRQDGQSTGTGTWSFSVSGVGDVTTEVTSSREVSNTIAYAKCDFARQVAGRAVRTTIESRRPDRPVKVYDYSLMVAASGATGKFSKNP